MYYKVNHWWKICLLVIYVDDNLILADEQELEQLKHALIQKFHWIMMEIGNAH